MIEDKLIQKVGLENFVTKQCMAVHSKTHEPYIYLQLGLLEQLGRYYGKILVVALVLKRTKSKINLQEC
jgi:hypothetical protein